MPSHIWGGRICHSELSKTLSSTVTARESIRELTFPKKHHTYSPNPLTVSKGEWRFLKNQSDSSPLLPTFLYLCFYNACPQRRDSPLYRNVTTLLCDNAGSIIHELNDFPCNTPSLLAARAASVAPSACDCRKPAGPYSSIMSATKLPHAKHSHRSKLMVVRANSSLAIWQTHKP